MTTSKPGTGSSLALLLAGAVLSSCMAHGPVRDIGIDTHPNFVSYNRAFYDRLLSGRAWILEGVYHPKYRNIVRGFVFSEGRFPDRLPCLQEKQRRLAMAGAEGREVGGDRASQGGRCSGQELVR